MAERSRSQQSKQPKKAQGKIRSNKGSANPGGSSPRRGKDGFEEREGKPRFGRERREEGAGGDRSYRPKRTAQGESSDRRSGKPRGESGRDSSYKPKKRFGDEEDRARPGREKREGGDRAYAKKRSFEERGRASGSGREKREGGDRPYAKKRSFEERGEKPGSGRERGEGQDRAYAKKRSFEERGGKPGPGREKRESGDRPYRSKQKSEGERSKGRSEEWGREPGGSYSYRPKKNFAEREERKERGSESRSAGKSIADRPYKPKPRFEEGEGRSRSDRGREAGGDRVYRPKRADETSANKPAGSRETPSPKTTRSSGQKGRKEKQEKGKIRLNKAIADAGIASRRKADEMIEAGQVRVNGNVVQELGTLVELSDSVEVNGKLIGNPDRERYILLNKPKDTITTTSDERGRQTVLDLIGARERLFPVGRLDRHTTGVLLLTNDGDLAYRLMHPSYEIERVYDVVLDKEISLSDARAIAQGVPIGKGEKSQPCYVSVQDSDRHNVTVVIREGKNREVRRMFESRGYQVKKLNRVSYAGLTYQGLGRGEWRDLKRHEVRELRKRLKLE